MAIIQFQKTQLALFTPFEANRVTALWPAGSGISSTDVQNAIEEAKSDALNNDRYPIPCSYGGNANAGRYLEIFPDLPSDANNAPFIAPDNSRIVAYSFGCVANSTGTIIIRNLTTATNLVTITFTNQKRVTATGLTVGPINALDEIGIFVGSGSFNKPFGRTWFNTET